MQGRIAIQHIVETLPDSISKRKALLQDTLALLDQRDPVHGYIATMLWQITDHERMQAELPLNYEKLK